MSIHVQCTWQYVSTEARFIIQSISVQSTYPGTSMRRADWCLSGSISVRHLLNIDIYIYGVKFVCQYALKDNTIRPNKIIVVFTFSTEPNFHLDATYIILRFEKIKYSTGEPSRKCPVAKEMRWRSGSRIVGRLEMLYKLKCTWLY